MFLIGQWPNTVYKAVFGAPGNTGIDVTSGILPPKKIPVMYAQAGCEVRAGQHLSIPGRQSSLHEQFTIGKLPQPGALHGPLMHQGS